jgi:hypothetical protein
MTVEELLSLPEREQVAAMNADLKKRGRLYEDGGIFRSTDMIGVFNMIQNGMADEPDESPRTDG